MTRMNFPGLLMAAVLALVLILPGCKTLPFANAKGVDEQAYAVLGSYQIFQKQALKVVQDQTLPADIRRGVAQADEAAFPVLRSLDQALTTFLDIKDQVDAGTSTQAKLAIAIANLKDWTTKADAAVKSLRDAVRKKKPVARAAPMEVLTYRSV